MQSRHDSEIGMAACLADVGANEIGGPDNDARRTCREVVALLDDDDPKTAFMLAMGQIKHLNSEGDKPAEFFILYGVVMILADLAKSEIAAQERS